MGACESQEIWEQSKRSREIDAQLRKSEPVGKQKLLILGPGESGKSTCLKQMQLLHNNGFSEKDRKEKKIIVFVNVVTDMEALLEAMENYGIILDNDLQTYRNTVHKISLHLAELTTFSIECKTAIEKLWRDRSVQKMFSMRSEFQISDSAAYLFNNLDRFAEPDYLPTSQDILHTRVPTTGVVKLTFNVKSIIFEVFDVGGQRSERRKWIHCFDDVNGVIFIVAVSEYDQTLREDNITNRLLEALDLYEGIINSIFFKKSCFILFLNKKDIFAEKIQSVSLKACFPSYRGGLKYSDGMEYIKKEFRKLNRQKKKVYMHETCATDTDQVQVVINSVIDTIIQENLRDTGML